MGRYSSPRELLGTPGFEKWTECDCEHKNCTSITRKLQCGANMLVGRYGDYFAAVPDWPSPYPRPGAFEPTPEGMKVMLEWTEWAAKLSGGWEGETLDRVILGHEEFQGTTIPECLIESRSIVRPAFLEAFHEGLRESGLNGVAVIADPSNLTESAMVAVGFPMILGAALYGALQQLEPMIVGPELAKEEGSCNG